MRAVGHGDIVDLSRQTLPGFQAILICGCALTVLSEKIHRTLSHAVPSLGAHPSLLANALARSSDRWKCSLVECVWPVSPHVKGFRLSEIARRPYFSFLINSAIGTVSGGSVLPC